MICSTSCICMHELCIVREAVVGEVGITTVWTVGVDGRRVTMRGRNVALHGCSISS